MPDRVDPASDRLAPHDTTERPASPGQSSAPPRPHVRARQDDVVCERCGTAMFRMHAVWRCPSCGYKTDCCGW